MTETGRPTTRGTQPQGCLTPEEMLAVATGDVAGPAGRAAIAHASACDECQQAVHGLRALLSRAQRRADARRWAALVTRWVPVAAALILGIAVGASIARTQGGHAHRRTAARPEVVAVAGDGSFRSRPRRVQSDFDLASAINQNRRAVKSCFQLAIERDEIATSFLRLNVRVQIDLWGGVASSAIMTPPAADLPDLVSCLQQEIALWRFPLGDRPYQAEFPLVFHR